MTDHLEPGGEENEDALRRALRRLDTVPGEPWGGGPAGEGGPALGGPDLQRTGDGPAGPEMVSLEMEDVLHAYGGPELAPGPWGMGDRTGGPDARMRVPPEINFLEMEDGLREYGGLGSAPVLPGLGGGPGPGGPPPEGDAPLPGPAAPRDRVPPDGPHAPDRRTGPAPLLEELRRLERAAASLPARTAAAGQTGGSVPHAGTWPGRTALPPAPEGGAWTALRGPAPSPGGELDQAERVDRIFRRDSRRYDGGFYLY